MAPKSALNGPIPFPEFSIIILVTGYTHILLKKNQSKNKPTKKILYPRQNINQ